MKTAILSTIFCVIAVAWFVTDGSWQVTNINWRFLIEISIFTLIAIFFTSSPIGVWLSLGDLGKIRKLNNENKKEQKIMKIWGEVLGKYTGGTPELLIYDDVDNNALVIYGWWQSKVLVSSGLAQNGGEKEVAGILAHELGHLHHRHCFWSAFTYGVMWPIRFTSYIAALGLYFFFILILGWGRDPQRNPITDEEVDGILIFCLYLRRAVHYLHKFLSLIEKRQDEFEADAFAVELGYGQGLVDFFTRVCGVTPGQAPERGIWAWLTLLGSTHPYSAARVLRIRELMQEKKRIV